MQNQPLSVDSDDDQGNENLLPISVDSDDDYIMKLRPSISAPYLGRSRGLFFPFSFVLYTLSYYIRL